MRQIMLVVLLGGVAFAQTMADGSAAAAGGSAGVIGGKKVSDGLSRIFDKAERPAGKSAPAKQPSKTLPSASPLQGPSHKDESVPPAPPLARHAALPKPIARTPQPVPAAPPQPTEATAVVDLRTVAVGMDRAQVLELGEPASRMMTSDDGHLMEAYRYALGVVHLTDGAVSSVDVSE